MKTTVESNKNRSRDPIECVQIILIISNRMNFYTQTNTCNLYIYPLLFYFNF